MKRIFCILMVTVMCLGAACSAEQAETAAVDEGVFLEEIAPNILCLDSCELEMFGADVDFEEEYFCVYESEQSYDNGWGPVAKLYQEGEEATVSEYFPDPVMSSYYPVRNFQTNEEVRAHLEEFLSPEITEEKFHDDFLEYDGKLYLVRGARGYGAITCDKESVAFLEKQGDSYYATMDYLYFGDYDYTVKLEFQKKDGKWMLMQISKMPA
ncbi:hypothetical protein H9X85_08845 [Anaerotignum lactatifermentans]|uniref:Lipoprotein n=1 Tax=Anaerotignum lactatifermentans TaxID=160404 RepID=A0ABS2G9T4_9FIRM|nr:hypothetical protein [Anaerotignum lactatifermentans]MBM6829829.1 hypothetical protein [Anaerotignum lactatifermentans]MBM6878231.1 hypothetical protein [Anaerotignum lactatifermentans]MBM6951311.1 hypothetical protein [Anaerotignum lactatifermentans]